jgi:hypothetical protein
VGAREIKIVVAATVAADEAETGGTEAGVNGVKAMIEPR